MKYVTLDELGYIVSIITTAGDQPPGTTPLTVDIGVAPSAWHKYNLASATWVDTRDAVMINIQLAHDVRAKRDSALNASDWTQTADNPIANKAAWATYRQALRDIPGQPGFPTTITWPQIPS